MQRFRVEWLDKNGADPGRSQLMGSVTHPGFGGDQDERYSRNPGVGPNPLDELIAGSIWQVVVGNDQSEPAFLELGQSLIGARSFLYVRKADLSEQVPDDDAHPGAIVHNQDGGLEALSARRQRQHTSQEQKQDRKARHVDLHQHVISSAAIGDVTIAVAEGVVATVQMAIFLIR